MVELDEALYLRHLIRHLCQLGGEQALLSGQDLQIGGGAMLHQEGGAAVGCLQGIDLLCVQLSFLLGGLVLHQCLVDRTAFDVINEAVLTDVRYQLKYSQKSIKEIADYLDFPNISFFGKFVRRHVGCSPKEYRRRLQAGQ